MQRRYTATPVAMKQFSQLAEERVAVVVKVEFGEDPPAINYTLYGVYRDIETALMDLQPGSYGWNIFVGFNPEIYWNNDKEYLCYSDPHISGGFGIVKIQSVDTALLVAQYSL